MQSSEKVPIGQPLIDPEIAQAWTLPASFYVDPQAYEQERERIFQRTWQVVGDRDLLAKPGDYFTTELAGEPLLLVLDSNSEVRGFYNVCRHRAGPPAQGCGSRKVFRCGYHGWTYGLDGKLISAPEFDGVEAFDPERFSLRPVEVAEWSGLIFVNLDDHGESLGAFLGDLSEYAGRHQFRKMKLFERRTYEMKCNWKTYVDNYLEGYHLPTVHPGLNRELDYGAYEVEIHPAYVRQFSPMRGVQPGQVSPRRYEGAHQDLTTDYFWV